MSTPQELEAVVAARLAQAEPEIEYSLSRIAEGNPLAAEPDPRRLRDRLQAKASLSREEAEAVSEGIRARSAPAGVTRMATLTWSGPEAIYGDTLDFVGISFLERGRSAAHAVARVAFRNGGAVGSGLMVSPRLFLTNNHVLGSAAAAGQLCVEFDYELDPADRPRGTTRFALDSTTFFLTDPINGLDYTLIAVGERLSGPKQVTDFGWCSMCDASNKHALGEVANIVQHPDGRYKEVVLRENRLVARLDEVLHYVADTEPGSSGSPVFNNEWKVIALHHWGGPWRAQTDARGRPLNQEINEGIRISTIVRQLRTRVAGLPAGRAALLREVIKLGEEAGGAPAPAPVEALVSDSPVARLAPDGSITWRVPLEISVRLPGFGSTAPAAAQAVASAASVAEDAPADTAGSEALRPSQNYENRSGYKPQFIEGFDIPLPKLTTQQRLDAARNQRAEPGDDKYELKYHHFSVVMNRKRRLAYFTACNINGASAKHVDRKTGDVSPLEPGDPHLESLAVPGGAEASETWFDDPRLDPAEYAGKGIYEDQTVPGFPNKRSKARQRRMFQRGHLVRRMDPAWGSDQQALTADADTFHWTNCSPQVGFFNMGEAQALKIKGTEGGKLWRAIENYVLRNAVAQRSRISCFTGSLFLDNDRSFRGIKVPGRFWKVIVWAEGQDLRSIALIADQRPVMKVWPEGLAERAEAFMDEDEVLKVDDFLTTVEEIERLTQLNFGDLVRAADVSGGEKVRRLESLDEIPLRPPAPARHRNGSARRPVVPALRR